MKQFISISLLISFICIGCTTQEKPVSDSTDSVQVEAKGFYDKSVSSSLKYQPARATNRSEQIIIREAYTLSYNKDWVNCNWVYWKLTRDHCYGNVKRNGHKFVEDNEVSGYKATHQDYIQSGYDRGHMCPAGDNQWSGKAMSQTFILSNICPQDHNLNTGDWNDLEQACRLWAKTYGEVYIVCGPIYNGNRVTKRIGGNVGVPDAFFKCVVRAAGDPAGLGFIYNNVGKHHEMDSYVCSIDEVEKRTGLDFFKGLPDEAAIESRANFDDWRQYDPDYSKKRARNKFDNSRSGGKKKKKKKNENFDF